MDMAILTQSSVNILTSNWMSIYSLSFNEYLDKLPLWSANQPIGTGIQMPKREDEFQQFHVASNDMYDVNVFYKDEHDTAKCLAVS